MPHVGRQAGGDCVEARRKTISVPMLAILRRIGDRAVIRSSVTVATVAVIPAARTVGGCETCGPQFGVRYRKNPLLSPISRCRLCGMTGRQFYDWQTAGGADDVMRMVDTLERAELHWCAIGGIAVNHWAAEPMVTRDVDFVVATEEIERAVALLEVAGFPAERHPWSVNFRGRSQVSLQLSTEDFYREFPARSTPADVHGMLLRVASLEDTLAGKIKAWRTPERRRSKSIKDLGDIARLVEAHPHLATALPPDVTRALER